MKVKNAKLGKNCCFNHVQLQTQYIHKSYNTILTSDMLFLCVQLVLSFAGQPGSQHRDLVPFLVDDYFKCPKGNQPPRGPESLSTWAAWTPSPGPDEVTAVHGAEIHLSVATVPCHLDGDVAFGSHDFASLVNAKKKLERGVETACADWMANNWSVLGTKT